MSTCEKCWRDAAMRVATMGGSQVDRYRELFAERTDTPCTAAEQDGEEKRVEEQGE